MKFWIVCGALIPSYSPLQMERRLDHISVELQKALDLGYIIIEVYHGVEYIHWLENDKNCEGGLFTSYINGMMEEKIYSSGWPSNGKTEKKKDDYIAEYKEKEHIDISDKSRFSKNPGKRAVAKLMLNFLWGKVRPTGGLDPD